MASEAPELSIIIVSYNTKDITIDCLMSIDRSLKDTPLTYEIIVWDNNSHDGSANALESYASQHPHVHFYSSKENIGFGRGNNRAVEHARGSYLLLLNSDTIIIDHAIHDMLEYYKNHEDTVHFLGPKILNKDGSDQPSAAPFYTPPVVFAALFLRGDHLGISRYSPNTVKKVDWLHGACIMTKRSIYNELHGFDESIFMYMEEVDLTYRARKLGYSCYFYPGARITHLGSMSSGGRTFPILQVYKGFLWFYRRHYSPFSMLLLKSMLKLKALLAFAIGKLTRNTYLINTYEEAYKLVEMA